MARPYAEISGDPACGLLLIADHASSHVPPGIDLGIPEALLAEHVALDIGVDPLGRALCAMLGAPGILGAVSRLVTDFNREEDRPSLIPVASDGHAITGNMALNDAARLERIGQFWRPYHARIGEAVSEDNLKMLISLHSFTPNLRSEPGKARPWQIGILYNEDERAARIAIPLLEAAGVVTGDNLPYSGKVLNATMNMHGERNGIAYLGIEVRQDLIDHAAGVAHWASILAPIITMVRDRLG